MSSRKNNPKKTMDEPTINHLALPRCTRRPGFLRHQGRRTKPGQVNEVDEVDEVDEINQVDMENEVDEVTQHVWRG